MKRMLLSMALVLGLVQVGVTPSFALTLNFASVPGSTIRFDGNADTFSFNPGPPAFNFQVGFADGSTDPDTVGLFGSVSGTFSIGAINIISASVQEAPVTGTGLFRIQDENGSILTADLQFVRIETSGTNGALNEAGQVNLSNVVYGGTNTDLLEFLSATNAGIATTSFTFIPARPLTTLTSPGIRSTTFSGSAAPVPEPMSLLLLGSGLAGIGIWRRWSQK